MTAINLEDETLIFQVTVKRTPFGVAGNVRGALGSPEDLISTAAVLSNALQKVNGQLAEMIGKTKLIENAQKVSPAEFEKMADDFWKKHDEP